MKRIKRNFRLKKSIFSKLVVSYIVFSVMVLVSFVVCLIVSMIYISGGSDQTMPPNSFVDEDGNILNMEQIEKMGGWVEELDQNFQVINVYGERQREQQSYTQEELSSLMNVSATEENSYIGVMQYLEKRKTYFLCIYERKLVQIGVTVMLGNQTQGGHTATRLSSVVFILLFISNCIILSHYLSKKIKKPLNQLVKGMEKVKAGEEGVYLDFVAEWEFVEIRDTFNLMMKQLEESRQEKEEMEQKKSQLLLELSHDIKTPLSTIKGYANALESDLVPEAKKMSYYQTIDKKADRVCSLAENMFLMLKMENPDFHLQLKQVDICELTRQICAEFYEDILNAGLSLDIDIPETPYYIQADEEAMARVIGNLLSNAGKYNQTGEQVGVKLSVLEKQVELRVWDDGEIISEDLQNIIFDPFVRGDKARKTNGGTGLGLSISKVIMEKQRGTLTYEVYQRKNCFVVRMGIYGRKERIL